MQGSINIHYEIDCPRNGFWGTPAELITALKTTLKKLSSASCWTSLTTFILIKDFPNGKDNAKGCIAVISSMTNRFYCRSGSFSWRVRWTRANDEGRQTRSGKSNTVRKTVPYTFTMTTIWQNDNVLQPKIRKNRIANNRSLSTAFVHIYAMTGPLFLSLRALPRSVAH